MLCFRIGSFSWCKLGINPLRELWNCLRQWNIASQCEIPAGVSGLISFHLMRQYQISQFTRWIISHFAARQNISLKLSLWSVGVFVVYTQKSVVLSETADYFVLWSLIWWPQPYMIFMDGRDGILSPYDLAEDSVLLIGAVGDEISTVLVVIKIRC